jgi:glycerophosphoryl diester phosphodiesterase
MAAFEAAFRLGADIVEVDVRRSRDGHLVLLHDPTLDRTTDATGPVSDRTLRDLEAVDAGSWFGPAFAGLRIPTAPAALELAQDVGRTIVLDIKGPSGTDAQLEDDEQLHVAVDVARLIESRHAQAAAVIASFNHRALEFARRAVPSIEVAPWMPEDRPADPVENIAATTRLGARVMIHTHTLLTHELMRAAHHSGIAVWAWTTTDVPSLDACMRFRPDALDGGDVVAMQAAIARAEDAADR